MMTYSTLLMLALGAPLMGAVAQAAPTPPPNLTSFSCWRMYTAKDGNTEVERVTWPATPIQDLGSSRDIVRFFVQHAKSMVVVSGKPNWHSPLHDVGPGTEIVLVLRGSSIGHFAHGKTQVFHAGDVVLIEDQNSKGRSVEFGPDGYLALTVTLDPGKP